MCGLGEMKNKPNEERISRKAASLQWTGDNTQAVMARLAQHGIIGELYRDIYIQVYKDGSYSDTLNIGDWLVEGEDGKLRFYDDETHALMYRPISDELERLRAFAREILDRDRGDDIGGNELPPMLYDAYWFGDDLNVSDSAQEDICFKKGMEYCYKLLLPYLKAALPHYESGVHDTRSGQVDVGKLAELDAFKELVTYGRD